MIFVDPKEEGPFNIDLLITLYVESIISYCSYSLLLLEKYSMLTEISTRILSYLTVDVILSSKVMPRLSCTFVDQKMNQFSL